MNSLLLLRGILVLIRALTWVRDPSVNLRSCVLLSIDAVLPCAIVKKWVLRWHLSALLS